MFNLIEEGLAMQKASLGKGPKESAATHGAAEEALGRQPTQDHASAADHTEKKPESQPLDYVEPRYKVCPACGKKHWRLLFDLCLSCSGRD